MFYYWWLRNLELSIIYPEFKEYYEFFVPKFFRKLQKFETDLFTNKFMRTRPENNKIKSSFNAFIYAIAKRLDTSHIYDN
jgi:hypothetical protein